MLPNDWFHIILRILYNEGGFNNDFIDIQPYLKNKIHQSLDKVNDINRIQIACDRIEEADFATFHPPVDMNNNLGFTNPIRVKLKLEGLKYILTTEREIKTTASLVSTNNFTKINIVIVIILTAILLATQIRTCYIQQEELNLQRNTINQKLKKLQEISGKKTTLCQSRLQKTDYIYSLSE